MAVRAKFKCAAIVPGSGDTKQYQFFAVTDDGTPENERYHRYTPGGRLDLTVDNPAVSFEINQEYYLDFTPAILNTAETGNEEQAAAPATSGSTQDSAPGAEGGTDSLNNEEE